MKKEKDNYQYDDRHTQNPAWNADYHFPTRGARSLAFTPASDLAWLMSAVQLLFVSLPKSSSGISAPMPAVTAPRATARPPRASAPPTSGRTDGVLNDPVIAMGP